MDDHHELQEEHTDTPLPNFPLSFPLLSLLFPGAFTKVLAGCWVRT